MKPLSALRTSSSCTHQFDIRAIHMELFQLDAVVVRHHVWGRPQTEQPLIERSIHVAVDVLC
jgi:hypothetical protein